MTDEKFETNKILEILEKISNNEIDKNFVHPTFKFSSTNTNFEDNEEEINEDLRTEINDYISAINNYCSKLNEYNKEEHTKEEKESISEELKQIETNFCILELQLKQEKKYKGFGKKSLINFYYKLALLDRNENLEIRENIMEKIGINDLAFYVYIDNIRYDFLFTKDNITMLDYSTGNTLSIDYYDKRIISFVFKKMGIPKEKYFWEENHIFIKNKNGLSICNVMLKNIYNAAVDKRCLIDEFQFHLSEYNLKPEEPFIKAICESGNNIDIFKYVLLNKYLDKYNPDIFAAACFGGNTEMVRVLEQQIGNINDLNNNLKFNILKQACAGNDYRIVEYLINKYFGDTQGILFLENNGKIRELFEVIKYPTIAIFLLKETKSKGLINNNFLNSTFFYTVMNEHTEIAELLLSQPGVEINGKSSWENAPLIYAARDGKIEIVQLLISKQDIEINVKDRWDGNTPLHFAVKSKNTEMVQLLLKHPKIDVNAEKNRGCTPLHDAVRDGHVEIVQLLLKHPKIEINTKDHLGYTPLCNAAIDGHAEIVQLLLSNENIDINLKYILARFYFYQIKNKFF